MNPNTISLVKNRRSKSISLTSLYNLALYSLTVFNISKTALIIPILKPFKSTNSTILLSPVVKTLESMILNSLSPHIATTALHNIHEQITYGLYFAFQLYEWSTNFCKVLERGFPMHED